MDIRKWMASPAVFAASVVLVTSAAAADAKTCINQSNNSTAAFTARDWQAVLSFTAIFLAECRDVLPDNHLYFREMATRAIALRELGRSEEALAITDDCIRQDYRIVDCHMERFIALSIMSRVSEARVEKDRTLKLISSELGRNDLDESERSMLTSMLNYLVNN